MKYWKALSAWQKKYCYPESTIHCYHCGMYPRNGMVGFSPICCEPEMPLGRINYQANLFVF